MHSPFTDVRNPFTDDIKWTHCLSLSYTQSILLLWTSACVCWLVPTFSAIHIVNGPIYSIFLTVYSSSKIDNGILFLSVSLQNWCACAYFVCVCWKQFETTTIYASTEKSFFFIEKKQQPIFFSVLIFIHIESNIRTSVYFYFSSKTI